MSVHKNDSIITLITASLMSFLYFFKKSIKRKYQMPEQAARDLEGGKRR